MNFQSIYENLQNQFKDKVTQIDSKKKEITSLEIEAYKVQGAMEMVVAISKEMEQEQKDEPESVEAEKVEDK
jgi:6,7-dimethyl-8-ribityllumazine synthase